MTTKQKVIWVLALLGIANSQGPIAKGQDWHCVSFGGYGVSMDGNVLTIPTNPDYHYLAGLLTTTNTSELLGDLTGNVIVAILELDATLDATLWFPFDCQGSRNEFSNVRPYFTVDPTPYYLRQVNSNYTNYWWADYSFTQLSVSNYGSALPGVYQMMAPLTPDQWSDSLGHPASDTNYTDAFNLTVANVAQIGLSFGGGCYADVGVGTATGMASVTILSYSVVPLNTLAPVLTITNDGTAVTITLLGLPQWTYTVMFSPDLVTWNDFKMLAGNSSFPASPGFYRARMVY